MTTDNKQKTAAVKDVKEPVKDTKAPIEAGALCIGLVIGAIFTMIALTDLSVNLFDNTVFIQQYYIWKENAPIIKAMVSMITMLVPIAIIDTVMSVYQTFTLKATGTRNFCDMLNALSFVAVIVLNLMYLAKYEQTVVTAALAGEVDVVTQEYVSQHIQPMIVNVILNFVMLFLPIIRYVSQENAKIAAAAPVEEVKKVEEKSKKD